MNLIEILRARVQALPVGNHTAGLRAVHQHVEVAVKEAYRVLAGKDPHKTRPAHV